MKEIKLTIDGKEVQLTDEQIKALGLVRKNPFGNNVVGEKYFSILSNNKVREYPDVSDSGDIGAYNAANYFNDKHFAEQVALHQLLYRKLLKFSYDNDCEDMADWKGDNTHWAIRYGADYGTFFVDFQIHCKTQDVYFSSEEGAKRAIEEVVEPFMKEHPEFKW